MSDRPNESDHTLDTLARADLDRRADVVDPRALFARIKHSMGSSADAVHDVPHSHRTLRLPVGRRIARWVSGISAAAAAVVIAVLLATQGATTAQASPEAILREAQKQALVPRDRCYLVEARKESELLEQGN